MIGPPEFVHIDMKDTDTPAIAEVRAGKGTVDWIPWNLGALYYRHSLPAHAGLFRDLVDRLDAAAADPDRRASAGGNDPDAAGRADAAARRST